MDISPRTRTLCRIAAGFTLATFFALGCTSTDGGSDGNSNGSGWDRPSYPDVPREAKVLTDGFGIVRTRMPGDGKAYVVDDDRRSLLYSVTVKRSDEIEIVPRDNDIRLNGYNRYNGRLDERSRHVILFEKKADPNDDIAGPNLPGELRGASRVAYGKGDLSYSTKERGNAFVYDRTKGRIVYKAELGKGFRINVSPRKDQITLEDGGRAAGPRGKYDLDPSREYEIYFKKW
jgi:hypothetical protein